SMFRPPPGSQSNRSANDMARFAKSILGAVFLLCALWAGRTSTHAQSAPSGRGAVVGTGVFTSFVENMDRSLGFYHDVFGMDVPAMPASGERPYNNPNPRLFMFFHIPGAKERHQSARAAGTRVAIEFMEIQNVDHTAVSLRIQDPGNATPVLVVRDLDAAIAALRRDRKSMGASTGMDMALGDGWCGVLSRRVVARMEECS